jgi:putative membrane protein
MRPMALNQGFYNLFLAIVTAVGIVFTATGSTVVGAALVLAGIGSMVAAALVLVISDPTKRDAALKQGLVPLLAIIALVVGLLL